MSPNRPKSRAEKSESEESDSSKAERKKSGSKESKESKESNRVPAGFLGRQWQPGQVVYVVEDGRLSAIAAMGDMMRRSGDHPASLSCHGCVLSLGTNNVPLLFLCQASEVGVYLRLWGKWCVCPRFCRFCRQP